MPDLRRWFSLGLRLLLPLLVVVGLQLSPRPIDLDQAYQASRLARQRGWHDVEARALGVITTYMPWRGDIWERRGVEALAAGQAQDAVDFLGRAGRQGALSEPGRAALGEALWQNGDADGAVAAWLPLMQAHQAESWMFERAVTYTRASGQRVQLAALLALWVQEPDAPATAAYELGILLLPDAPEEARAHLRTAGRREAQLRGGTYTIEQALDEAARSEEPAYGMMLLGRALGSAGEWAAAERTFQRAVELQPGYAEAWAFLAEAQQQIGGSGQAAVLRALELDPSSVAARSLAALYHRRAGNPREALAYLEGLAQEFHGQALWRVEIANTLAEMGKPDEALAHLQAVTELEPRSAEHWQTLARFSASSYLEVREVGLPAARKALSLAPGSADAMDAMGLVLMRLEDLAGAERFLSRALQINPSHAGAHLHLGTLYLDQARMPQAGAHLRQARDQAGPGQPEVRILAQRLLEQNGFSGE